MTRTNDYYNQEGLFGRGPEPYQVQVLADVLDLLPEDIESVLDVGCGDGYITDALPEHLRVVGLDISEEALRHVKRPTRIGSITGIPFADGFFDLVMANDIIEHLPDGDYAGALDELSRVSSKYVLITAPHREHLAAQQARCAECGCVYHLNRHHRSFDEWSFLDLFGGSLRPVEIRYSGDLILSPPDPTIPIKHEQGFFRTWEKGVCPDCGSGRQVAGDNDSPFLRALNAVCCTAWSRSLCDRPQRNNRTEIMVLYAAGPTTRTTKMPQFEEKTDSPLDIDFSNKFQSASFGFTLGSPWAQFYLPAGAIISDEGVGLAPETDKAVCIPIRIPVETEAGDTIRIYASGGGKSGTLGLTCTDGISHIDRRLFRKRIRSTDRCIEVSLPERLWPDQYGVILDLHLFGNVRVRSLTYEPAGRPRPETTFIRLSAGHNVLYADRTDPAISWGLTVESEGYYPKPDFESQRMDVG
ncbi:MAG: class I SAM-dependent methyltransferase [Planctomycetota bacterium]|nr:class I SAM-dependent methyltransferase [Planctomycetota bacterium]